ncbi:PREDICTED: uncharacterized protein LOC109588992, partial [Amphimedon queenslandica]|uniref:Tudor domain-containing protein n=1 Tax=Amphimedon queenslandica TaxID=400682 RepID=A0AAN0JUD5_AMPQE
MSNDRQSQLTAAMRTAQKHQHSLALTRNNLCVARQKLNDCKTKVCRGEELIQICQARIQKVARSLYLEISKQEEKLDDFDCELRKVEEAKRRAVVKCHAVLQTNEEKEDLDNLLYQLTCAVDLDTCTLSEVHIPRIIINRDVLQESLEDSYHLASESSSSVFNTPPGGKGQEEEEEEEEEDHNETTSSFSLSPPQVNDPLAVSASDDVNDSSASVNVVIKEGAESVRSCTPVGQSTPNLQGSQFLSPSLSPKVPRGYSSCTSSSSRGSTPGPTDTDMTGAVGVIVSHINSPSEFYIQYTSDLPSLDHFHSELKGESLQRISGLQKNLVCVVVREDSYRRCQVESSDDHSYPSVQLLDYGNSEIVNVHSLFYLPSKFKETPLFAHKCRLEGIGPMSSGRHDKYQITPQNVWSHSANSFFKSVCEDKTDIKMKVFSKEGNVLFVDIIIPSSSGGLSIARQL